MAEPYDMSDFEPDDDASMSTCVSEVSIDVLTDIYKKRHEWKNVPLTVAITGRSGTGKSSFINAIRGLDAEDKGAATVGEVETTTIPTPYADRENTNLIYWDLPGVGTPKFKRDEYLAKINFHQYDFFLILATERFTEDDLWLANEIHDHDKKFFFVRTKIDNSVRDDKQAHKKTHNEVALLARIKQDCVRQLRHDLKFKPDVFLISNFRPLQFDFEALTKKLIADFPVLKRDAMVLSMNGRSRRCIKEKAKVMRARVQIAAGLSAATGVLPIPGLGGVIDAKIITDECAFYRKQFGLDDQSLAFAAGQANKELKDIKFLCRFDLWETGTECVIDFLSVWKLNKVQLNIMSIIIPIVGSAIAATASYKGTAAFLEQTIDSMEKVSLKINKYITEQMSVEELSEF